MVTWLNFRFFQIVLWLLLFFWISLWTFWGRVKYGILNWLFLYFLFDTIFCKLIFFADVSNVIMNIFCYRLLVLRVRQLFQWLFKVQTIWFIVPFLKNNNVALDPVFVPKISLLNHRKLIFFRFSYGFCNRYFSFRSFQVLIY